MCLMECTSTEVVHRDCDQLSGQVIGCLGTEGSVWWITCYLYEGNKWSITDGYLGTYPFNILVSNLEEVTEQTLVRFSGHKNLDDHLILLRAGLPFRGASSGWRNGLTGTS